MTLGRHPLHIVRRCHNSLIKPKPPSAALLFKIYRNWKRLQVASAISGGELFSLPLVFQYQITRGIAMATSKDGDTLSEIRHEYREKGKQLGKYDTFIDRHQGLVIFIPLYPYSSLLSAP